MINRGQYMDIKELRSEGLSIRDIARRKGLSRNMVRRVSRSEHPMQIRAGVLASMLEPGTLKLSMVV